MPPLYPWPADAPGYHNEEIVVALPLLSAGNTDKAITWATPFNTTGYAIVATVQQGTVNLGAITPYVKDGSVTTTGCTVTLVNSLLISVAAGASLHVIASGS